MRLVEHMVGHTQADARRHAIEICVSVYIYNDNVATLISEDSCYNEP
jgi:hypothetical protein